MAQPSKGCELLLNWGYCFPDTVQPEAREQREVRGGQVLGRVDVVLAERVGGARELERVVQRGREGP